MATKLEELNNPNSAWNKADQDEPLFILRAQDLLAPVTVEYWIALARSNGVALEKLANAEEIAEVMREWSTRKMPD